MHRFSIRLLSTFALTALVASAVWATPPVSFEKSVESLAIVPLETAPVPDVAAARAEDAIREAGRAPGPYRFAVKSAVDYRPSADGKWTQLDDGSKLWRLRIRSPGALSLILTMDRFEVSEGARLWVYSPDGRHVLGPFGRADAQAGRLWTPILRGDVAVVELHEPAGIAGRSDIHITQISHGYRGLFDAEKQGSCNIDTVCAQADPWDHQVRSVVMYGVNGNGFCTGTLVNNTAQDGTPYVLTADHCGPNGNFPDLTFYFNFESPICGALSGGSMAQSLQGATVMTFNSLTDMALLRLSSSPPASYNAYYAGWDASSSAPQSVVAVHHPSGDEKAISFDGDTLISDWWSNPNELAHWQVVDWDSGTTEPGSSGSAIFKHSNGLLVGTLTGGDAACGNDESDWYGKFSEQVARSNIRQFLDPLNTGQTTLNGLDPNDGGECVESSTVRCLNNGRFAVSIRWQDFEGTEGDAIIVDDSDDSSFWWFFTASNWEMMVKVLDGCDINNHFWVFAAAVSNVEYTLTVTDTQTDETQTYFNRLGVSAPAITDTEAFAACP